MAAKRSMWPKEHGAYVQLGFPLATALLAGHSTPASWALAVAASFAFVAHEAAAVLIGVRGTRARREHATRARAWLAATGASAILFGALGTFASSASRPFAVAGCVAAVIAALVLCFRKERTTVGEIVASSALAGAAAPVGAASGLPSWLVLTLWGAWTVQFAATTVAVHAIVRRHAPWLTLLVACVGVGVAALCGASTALAVAPTCLVCAVVVLASVSAKSIRKVGFAFAATLLASGVTLIIGARS